REIRVIAFTESIGPISLLASETLAAFTELQTNPWKIDEFSLRCPSFNQNQEMEALLRRAKESGESFGGTIGLRIVGLPKGLGQPVFGKLKSSIADALMGV